MRIKSITEVTWKDAAAIEARSLIARLEDIAAKGAANPQAMLGAPMKQRDLESVTRQATKLAELIDQIEEQKPKRQRATKEGR